jgi:hypothetical protein
MSQISRLKEVEIANGNLINADDLNAEFDQLVSESNSQDQRVTALESGAVTVTGVKTFNTPPRMNQVDEASAQAGVRIDGVLCRDGVVNSKPILATIANVDSATDQITTSSAHGLTTGNTVGLAVGSAGGELPGGLSESVFYYARVVSPSIITLHPSENDAMNGANTVNITSAGSGTFNLICDPATPRPGDIWVSQKGELKYQSLTNTYTILDTQGRRMNRYENYTAAPVYTSPTTFTVANIACRDWADNYNIVNDLPVTVNVSSPSLNGTFQTNAAGTVSVANGSSIVSVSGGNGGFMVGDVIVTLGGQARRVTAVDGSGNPTQVHANWTATETNVPFKYGGRCGNTWYYAYATITSGNVGIYLSTRNFAEGQPIDFPTSGFRQLPFAIRLDSSGNIIPFYVEAGWPRRPKILYQVFYAPMLTPSGATNVLYSGASTTYTDLTAVPNFVPRISRQAVVLMKMYASAVATGYIRQKGTTGPDVFVIGVSPNSQLASQVWTVPTNANQMIEYRVSIGSADIDVMGYIVTEVL